MHACIQDCCACPSVVVAAWPACSGWVLKGNRRISWVSDNVIDSGWGIAGDWEAAEKRAAAGPDEEAGSDDEVFGDFEDIEAGTHLMTYCFLVLSVPSIAASALLKCVQVLCRRHFCICEACSG